ncbi:DUF6056 family protein [Aureimonas sp. SK2]|uniref:DUF6056 family protein n=1 Tax=Aureimonas sp. SK2 TaxID=3015992 RepID=UPI002444B964|nr:DUF6056 family protein [Aureimonas sp. SK2]
MLSSTARGRLLALLLLSVPLFLANRAMPLFADDVCRAIGAGPLEALGEAAREYGQWTGRFLVTFATYLLLGDARAPSPVFDVLNTLAFLGLVALLAAALDRVRVRGRGSEAPGALPAFTETLFLALALWWLPWSIGETALWTTGSIGYLWAVVAELAVVVLALRRDGDALVRWLLPPLALVAGSLYEPLSIAVCLFLAGLCALRWRRGGPMPLVALVAHAIGLLSTVLAPGNFVRAASLPPSDPFDRLPAVLDLAGRLFDLGWLVPLALLALSALVAPGGRRAGLAVLGRPAVWLLPLAALLYLLLHLALPAPTIAPRLGFPASVALAGFLFLVFRGRARDGRSERWLAGATVLALAGTIGFAAPRLATLSAISAEWQAKAIGQEGTDAVLPERLLGTSRIRARGPVLFVGLERDPAKGYNACFAKAYGLSSVRVVPD